MTRHLGICMKTFYAIFDCENDEFLFETESDSFVEWKKWDGEFTTYIKFPDLEDKIYNLVVFSSPEEYHRVIPRVFHEIEAAIASRNPLFVPIYGDDNDENSELVICYEKAEKIYQDH